MPTRPFTSSLALGLLALLSGCAGFNLAPTLVPQAAQLPLLPGRGAVEGQVSVGATGNEVQLAGALSNHFALTVQAQRYRRFNGKDGFPGQALAQKYDLFSGLEAGLGYYYWRPDGRVFALYGGGGYGEGNATGYEIPDGKDTESYRFATRARYATVYLLPMIGWRHNDQLEMAFGAKISGVRYSTLVDVTTLVDHRPAPVYAIEEPGYVNTHVQPIAQVSYTVLPRVRLVGRAGLDIGIGPRYQQAQSYRTGPSGKPYILSLGLSLRLGRQPAVVPAQY